MRALFIIPLLALLILPPTASAEVQTFTATHTYILGDHDSKDDARQRCLLEAKRKVIEQAGVYIESQFLNIESEGGGKSAQLTKSQITSFAAGMLRVEILKEDYGFEHGHNQLTLTVKVEVDLADVRKQLAARQVDTGVRDTVAAQQERLKRLEAQLEAMQRQMQQAPAQTPGPPTSDISAADLQTLRTQAAQGNATAQVSFGLLYHNGRGVPQDYAQARQWWEKAAAQGNAVAQNNLGWLYRTGHGVPQDYTKARQWYEQAAAQSNAMAQAGLGMLYFGGLGVPQDYAKARQWYEKAAVQGNAIAQTTLGWLYSNGQGVPQDYVRARQWFEKAAAQGETMAQAHLGWLYHNGHGVPQDYTKARQWYEQAAAQGNAMAQGKLGAMYATGREIVPRDEVLAYMWLTLAAADSPGRLQKLAAEVRDLVASDMTPAQLAEAQRLAREWQPKKEGTP